MKFLELARMTTATTGTGTVTLGSAVTGYISFATAGAVTGDVISYAIQDGANSEIGYGTYNSTGPTLTRNLIKSTTGALLSLTGNAEIFATIRAADLIPNSAGSQGGGPMNNGTLSVTASAGALTIALKTLAGTDPSPSDPVDFFFPAISGGYTVIRQTAALSLVVPSGATLAAPTGTPFRLWITAHNDSGTIRLGVTNCLFNSSSSPIVYSLADFASVSTTAITTGSATAGTIYTGTAVTSMPMRILGYAEWNASGVTAGTWTTTNMSVVRLYSPGLPLPGSVVQVQSFTNSGTTAAVATTTVQTTGLSVSYGRRSLCNAVLVEAQGTLSINIGGTYCISRIYRAGGIMNSASIALIYSDGISTGQYTMVGAAMQGLDCPIAGQSASTTYDVRINTSAAGGTGQWNQVGGVTQMTLTEIQS